jgi:hypothetical protein
MKNIMKRLLAPCVLLAILALASLAQAVTPQQYATMLLTGAGRAAASSTPFALDGSPQQNTGNTTSLVLPGLSTTFSNDVVYVVLVTQGGPGLNITGGGLTFTRRATLLGGGNTIEIWSAVASSPLSSAVFTCTSTAGPAFFTAVTFAFSGAHSASPFDANGAIPSTFASGAGVTITTSNANDILIAASANSPAIDAPYTRLSPAAEANFLSVGYQIVSATQSASPVTWAGAANSAVAAVDAIIKGP